MTNDEHDEEAVEQPGDQAPEEVSPEEIVEQTAAIHEQLDQFKDWSLTISNWLENERRRLREEGNVQGASQTLRLIQHVDSVGLRIELGDANLRPTDPSGVESDASPSTTNEEDSDAE